jgi:hypothetical protein
VGTNGIGGRVGVPGGTGERVGNDSPKFSVMTTTFSSLSPVPKANPHEARV